MQQAATDTTQVNTTQQLSESYQQHPATHTPDPSSSKPHLAEKEQAVKPVTVFEVLPQTSKAAKESQSPHTHQSYLDKLKSKMTLNHTSAVELAR